MVDNGSTDASAAVGRVWADRYDAVRFVDGSRVSGPGAARNAGRAIGRWRAAGLLRRRRCGWCRLALGVCGQARRGRCGRRGVRSRFAQRAARSASPARRHPAARIPPGRARGQPRRPAERLRRGRRVRRGAPRRRGHRPVLAPAAPGVPVRGGHRRRGGQARAARVRPGLPARNDLRAQCAGALPALPARRRSARSGRCGPVVALAAHPGAPAHHPGRPAATSGPTPPACAPGGCGDRSASGCFFP